MKQPFLFTLLVVATFVYINYPESSNSTVEQTVAATAANISPATEPPAIIIAAAPPSYNRWKTGPNAQTAFEPFAPSEHATWNKSSGYTIIGGSTR